MVIGFSQNELTQLEALMPHLSTVRDQGLNSTCYAFATVGCFEARMRKEKNEEITLNVSELVENMKNKGYYTSAASAVDFLENFGIRDEEGYYEYPIESHKILDKAEEIVRALDEDGQVILTVEYGQLFDELRHGRTDIYYPEPTMTLEKEYHSLVAFGHGRCGDTKYYFVQNSHGLDWGFNGIGRVLCDDEICPIEAVRINLA